jgi:hypothetical protein
MLDDMKAAENKFLQDYKNLQRKFKDASAQERDQIRAQISDAQEAFIEQQKEMREEFQKRVQELKGQLPNHGDVINAAKDNLKGKGNRKGGGN